MVYITKFKAESNSRGQCGHPVTKMGQYLEVYFQNVVFTVYAQFLLLNLRYIEPKLELFLSDTKRFFIPFLSFTLKFLYVLSDEVHKIFSQLLLLKFFV
jgi:hypothetical protein